jgi:hypothetical protein
MMKLQKMTHVETKNFPIFLPKLKTKKKKQIMGVGGLVFWTAGFIVVMVIFIELKERY